MLPVTASFVFGYSVFVDQPDFSSLRKSVHHRHNHRLCSFLFSSPFQYPLHCKLSFPFCICLSKPRFYLLSSFPHEQHLLILSFRRMILVYHPLPIFFVILASSCSLSSLCLWPSSIPFFIQLPSHLPYHPF